MTITDANGNTLKEGKPARNWACKHVKYALRKDIDDAGRITITFRDGCAARFFRDEAHPNFLVYVDSLPSE